MAAIPVVSANTHFVRLASSANTQLVCLERSLVCKHLPDKVIFTSWSMNMYLGLQQMDYCFSLCQKFHHPDTRLVTQNIEKVANLIPFTVEGIGAHHRMGSNL